MSARQLAHVLGYESGIDACKICQEHAGASENIRRKGCAGPGESMVFSFGNEITLQTVSNSPIPVKVRHLVRDTSPSTILQNDIWTITLTKKHSKELKSRDQPVRSRPFARRLSR